MALANPQMGIHFVVPPGLVKRPMDVKELFDNFKMIALDKTGEIVAEHYHVIGAPKMSKRFMRDLSKQDLARRGLTHPSAKLVYQSMKVCDIQNDQHYKNLLAYCRKKDFCYENHQI